MSAARASANTKARRKERAGEARASEGGEALYAELARKWSRRVGISKSTMMGLPCLRVHGKFFASATRDRSALLVKLSADRVREAVEEGVGENFAPNGRVFREWLALPLLHGALCEEYLREAHAFVAGSRSG